MILNPNTEIIVGPPGTGKTATLIKMATEIVRNGTPPDQIAYLSFTRQAVREASARIIAATGAARDSFSGFKTLHAMAFWLMGKRHKDITDTFDIKEIAWLPQHLDSSVARERTKSYAQLYNYHRMTGTSLTACWEAYAGRNAGTEEDFLEWVLLYQRHKSAQSKIDFVDLIQEFVAKGTRFPFEYIFVDEAQDFSMDQWAAVSLLAKDARKVIVAGDSDQSVFGWSGAKSLAFDEIEGGRRVLSQSFRLPRHPFLLASRVLQQMERDVLYSPKTAKGCVSYMQFEELQGLPLDNGESWFILCRNNYQVKQISRFLFKKKLAFRHVSEAHHGTGIDKFIRYIRWYEEACTVGQISAIRRKKLEREVPDLESCIQETRPWKLAFSTWPIDRVAYLEATELGKGSGKIGVGTFHSSKGAEADNVVLLGDCTRRIWESIGRGEPEEFRAIYVAMTRTKNRLYLVQPQGRYGIQWSMFQRLPEDLINGLL